MSQKEDSVIIRIKIRYTLSFELIVLRDLNYESFPCYIYIRPRKAKKNKKNNRKHNKHNITYNIRPNIFDIKLFSVICDLYPYLMDYAYSMRPALYLPFQKP